MLHIAPGHLEVPEGRLPSDRVRPDGVVVHSLTAHALVAMDRHKWIESERAGRDLGNDAAHDWIDRFWKGWCRAKLIEHLYGWRCWGAFDEADFGLLTRHTVAFHVPRDTVERVADLLADGGENLDVVTWAVENRVDPEPIIWLLDRIDINAKRHRLLTDHILLFTERG